MATTTQSSVPPNSTSGNEPQSSDGGLKHQRNKTNEQMQFRKCWKSSLQFVREHQEVFFCAYSTLALKREETSWARDNGKGRRCYLESC